MPNPSEIARLEIRKDTLNQEIIQLRAAMDLIEWITSTKEADELIKSKEEELYLVITMIEGLK